MKYGLIVYPRTANIGDEIQSYAALRFLPQVDYYVDREHLDTFCSKDGEQVAVIMNGWYLYNHLNWPPSSFIVPKLIGLHFDTLYSWYNNRRLTENYVFEGSGGCFLQQYGPVGCRDYHTLALTQKAGIDSYFSGCLTLCLQKLENVPKQEYICLVDVPEAIAAQVQKSTKRPVKILTHYLNLESLSYEQRLNKVEKYLKIYQGAHCVVTARLHCALPCLALETPVFFLYSGWMKDRLETYLPLLKHLNCDANEQEFLLADYYDIENPPENPLQYVDLRQTMINDCEKFVSTMQQDTMESLTTIRLHEDFCRRISSLKSYVNREANLGFKIEEENKLLISRAEESVSITSRAKQELTDLQFAKEQELAALRDEKEQELAALRDEKEQELAALRNKKEEIAGKLMQSEHVMAGNSGEINHLRSMLDEIYSSKFWKIASIYYNFSAKVKNWMRGG